MTFPFQATAPRNALPRRFRPHAAAAMLALAAVAAAPADARTSWVPLKLRQTSGTRPYVPVKLNGVPLLFMVHANAGFLAMTTHANAKRVGAVVTPTGKHYGIVSEGHVSDLGTGTATLKTLQVGDNVMRGVKLNVFEIPPRPVVDGMLGIKWLRAAHAIVDFGRLRLGIPAAQADSARERAALLSRGYVAHRLTWDDAAERYRVDATVNGVRSRFDVSTVAWLVIDRQLAARAGIGLTAPFDRYGGPSGTTGNQYHNATPVHVTIDGQKLKVPLADIHDIYAYDGDPRPAAAQQTGGYLGCDFMLSNKGVIDFGTGTLYLKP